MPRQRSKGCSQASLHPALLGEPRWDCLSPSRQLGSLQASLARCRLQLHCLQKAPGAALSQMSATTASDDQASSRAEEIDALQGDVHVVILHHGLWGNPGHLGHVQRRCGDRLPPYFAWLDCADCASCSCVLSVLCSLSLPTRWFRHPVYQGQPSAVAACCHLKGEPLAPTDVGLACQRFMSAPCKGFV